MATSSALPVRDASQCDVLVIGGGPAGSTAAALLAERGYRVTLFEKARHPRFHIGESLLPASLPLLERLGVADAVKAIGMEKWGVEFISPSHAHKQAFVFSDALNKTVPMAYQVRRAQFDEILIRNAARKNARVVEACCVENVRFLADEAGVEVQARHENGEVEVARARFLLDASGRDTFLASCFKAKRRNEKHNSAAVYAHFKGAQRNPGRTEGDISIFWFDHGWFWFIPLTDGVTSVGAVAWPYYFKTRKGKSLNEFLLETIALCPALQARLQHAQLVSEAEAAGNYTYVCDHVHGENYLLVGDAYTFIDPVFSSGVMLAMKSAFAAADTVDTCLQRPRRAPAALKAFDKLMRAGPKTYSWFIYRVTNPAMRDIFMEPREVFRAKAALLSVMAGDVYGNGRIRLPLLFFKAVYYATCLFNFRRTLKAGKMRKHNIRSVGEAGAAMN